MQRSYIWGCATPPTRLIANSSAAIPVHGRESSRCPSILGKSAGITPITRSGARPGDNIYVTGPLGGSILGRHMTFEPRVHLARKLAQSGVVTAMLDISDGLSRDLRQICDLSNVGAILDAAKIPIHADAVELAKRDHREPIEHALHDGEDHELLLTAGGELKIDGVVSDWRNHGGQRDRDPSGRERPRRCNRGDGSTRSGGR